MLVYFTFILIVSERKQSTWHEQHKNRVAQGWHYNSSRHNTTWLCLWVWGCGIVTVNWRKVLFVRLAKEGDLTKCEPGGEHFHVCCCESVGQGVDQNKFQECDAKSGVKQDYDMSRFLLVIDWNREKYSRVWWPINAIAFLALFKKIIVLFFILLLIFFFFNSLFN